MSQIEQKLVDSAVTIAHLEDPHHTGLIEWIEQAGDTAVSLAIKLTRHRDAAVRAFAIGILAQSRDSNAARTAGRLGTLRRDRSPSVRVAVASGLGVMAGYGVPIPIHALRDLSYDRAVLVRESAASTLGLVKCRAATRILARLARDSASSVRSWAALGLGFYPHIERRIARNALAWLLADTVPEVEEEAIVALVKARDSRAIDALMLLLSKNPPSDLMLEAYMEWPRSDIRKLLEQWLERVQRSGDMGSKEKIEHALLTTSVRSRF